MKKKPTKVFKYAEDTYARWEIIQGIMIYGSGLAIVLSGLLISGELSALWFIGGLCAVYVVMAIFYTYKKKNIKKGLAVAGLKLLTAPTSVFG